VRDHLPECPVPAMEAGHGPLHPEDAEANCICDWLRACEQRVRDEILTAAYESAPAQVRQDEVARLYNIGFADALDAAREAVESIRDAIYTHYRISCEPPGKVDWSQHRMCDPINEVLTAIDALRGEQP